MRRGLLLPALVALAAAAACGWAELVGYVWTDYELANEGPFHALVHGDLGAFLRGSPVDGPSLLLRAPFAYASWLWGGSDMAVYRLVAVPGLLAGAVLGVLLFELRARTLRQAGWGWCVLLLAAANPVTLDALRIGHPEELFGAVLCVAAVLAALHDRPWLSAVLLGLAMGNKAWAILAVGPVLLALPRAHWRVLGASAAVAAACVLPFVVASLVSGDGASAVVSAGRTDGIFQPWQLFWFLGERRDDIQGFFGFHKVGFRAAPGWISHVTHPLVVVVGVALAAAWTRVRRRVTTEPADVLLLLALCLLLRCVLDAANNGYYHLPFLLALLTWEALRREEPPVFTLVATTLVWFTVGHPPLDLSPDALNVTYLAWTLPACAWLAARVFGPLVPARTWAPLRREAPAT